MSTKTDPTPIRSGFCTPGNPVSSHVLCRKVDCPCEHHELSARADATGEVIAAVEDFDGPCRCWGTIGRITPHEAHCCMTAEATETGCHQDAGVAAYQAARKAAGLC